MCRIVTGTFICIMENQGSTKYYDEICVHVKEDAIYFHTQIREYSENMYCYLFINKLRFVFCGGKSYVVHEKALVQNLLTLFDLLLVDILHLQSVLYIEVLLMKGISK